MIQSNWNGISDQKNLHRCRVIFAPILDSATFMWLFNSIQHTTDAWMELYCFFANSRWMTENKFPGHFDENLLKTK